MAVESGSTRALQPRPQFLFGWKADIAGMSGMGGWRPLKVADSPSTILGDKIGSEGESMYDFDPVVLRRLAARYRERAKSEPDKAKLFAEIANDMEAHAERVSPSSKRG